MIESIASNLGSDESVHSMGEISVRVVNTRNMTKAKNPDINDVNEKSKIKTNNEGNPVEINIDKIAEMQMMDPNIIIILEYKSNGLKPTWSDISRYSPEVKCYWSQWDSLYIYNKILYRKFESDSGKDIIWQILLPKDLGPFVFKHLHDSVTCGHLGIKKTLSKVNNRFFWHKMRSDVENWCKSCDVCASRKMPQKKPKAPMQQYNVGAPLERVAVDILGPLPKTKKGNKYILVVGDYFSKWMQAIV